MDSSKPQEMETVSQTCERELLRIINMIPGPVARVSRDLRYLFVNAFYETLFGKPRDWFLGRLIQEVLDEEQFQEVLRYAQRALKGESITFERDTAPLLGARNFLMHVFPDRDEQGELVGLVIVGLDITARKQAEAALQQRESYQRAVLDNFPYLVRLKDQDSRFLSVNKAFAHAVGALSPESLNGKTDFDVWPPELAMSYRADDRAVLTSGQPKAVEEPIDISGQRVWFETFKSPVILNGQVIGSVGFARDITERKQFQDELERHRDHLEELVLDRTAELAASEAKFRALVEQSAIGIFIQQDGRFVYANPAMAKLHGLPQDELIGRSCHDFIAPEDRQRVVPMAKSMGVTDTIFRSVRADGTRVDLEVHARPLHYEGRAAAIGFILDVTERCALERLQRENEQRLRVAIAAAQAGMWEWDLDTGATVWSPEIWRLCGLRPDECEPSWEAWTRTVVPEDFARIEPIIREAIGRGGNLDVEWRVVLPETQLRWLTARGGPVINAEGKSIRYCGLVVDVTERKRLEQELEQHRSHLETLVTDRTGALQASELRFRTLFENNQSVMGLLDPDTGALVAVNQAAVDFYGYSREALLGMTIQQINLLAAERIVEAWKQAPQMKSHCQFVQRRADGSLVDVEVYSTPIDVEGKTLLFSIVHDISDRVQAERALLESEEALQRAQAVARIGSWRLDTETQCMQASEELYRLFAIPIAKRQNTYAAYISRIHPDDRAAVEQVHATAQLHGERFELEYRILLDHGVTNVIAEVGNAKKAVSGKVIGLIGTAMDITEQRAAEQARLNQAVAQRELLVREVHHRIKNHLQGLVGLLGRYERQCPVAAEYFQKAAAQTQVLATIHGLQAQFNRDTTEVGPLLSAIVETQQGLTAVPIALRQETAVSRARIVEASSVPVALIINELIVNALKHGNYSVCDSALQILVEGTPDGITLRFINPGHFRPLMTERPSTGLELARLLLPRAGASLEITSHEESVEVTLHLTSPTLAGVV